MSLGLDKFIPGWCTILPRWWVEQGMLCPRQDLQHLIRQLDRWFDNPAMQGMFKVQPAKPTMAQPPKPVDKLAEKEASASGGDQEFGS